MHTYTTDLSFSHGSNKRKSTLSYPLYHKQFDNDFYHHKNKNLTMAYCTLGYRSTRDLTVQSRRTKQSRPFKFNMTIPVNSFNWPTLHNSSAPIFLSHKPRAPDFPSLSLGTKGRKRITEAVLCTMPIKWGFWQKA